MKNSIYAAIDLKSFYASVECTERKLDPLNTNLVVADNSRTEKTICLAVSPSLKSYGISGRPRLFEVIQKVKEINAERIMKAPGRKFRGKSYIYSELQNDPSLELDFLVAPPRMAFYLKYSTMIYDIYLKYISPEDIHVYSIDEVFMDVTPYLNTYKMTAHELVMTMIRDVLKTTGITATAGIGTNLYLCKIAMDIVAKHVPPDKDGVRMAELDERTYREKLWDHRPLTDFWRVGRGYSRKLEKHGLFTMGDIARCSLGGKTDFHNQELLYKLFGVNAELLVDHAWGIEPCTIRDIRHYRPATTCMSLGQVLQDPYTFEKARIVLTEMLDKASLDLIEKGMMSNQLVLTIGYDRINLEKPEIAGRYRGKITVDAYGRSIPEHAHGTANLGEYTTSSALITSKVLELYDRIVLPYMYIRRITLSVNNLQPEKKIKKEQEEVQLSLFDIPEKEEKKSEEEKQQERSIQEAMLEIKKKFGKNSVLKGTDFEEGATMKERNNQIGGHKA